MRVPSHTRVFPIRRNGVQDRLIDRLAVALYASKKTLARHSTFRYTGKNCEPDWE